MFPHIKSTLFKQGIHQKKEEMNAAKCTLFSVLTQENALPQ